MRYLGVSAIFFIIRILWAVEQLGYYSRKIFLNSIRSVLYLVLLLAFFYGFEIKSSQTGLDNLPLVFNSNNEVLGASSASNFPKANGNIVMPEISATSFLAVDINSGIILASKNSSLILPPASTTKLITALVALDLYDLNDQLPIPDFCTTIEGQKSGFLVDDYYSVSDLLESLLINSGADSACSLAVGKLTYLGFIELMNKKAEQIGLTHSYFSNPIGLDGSNGEHVSTAEDLFKLGKYVRGNEVISKIVGKKTTTVESQSGIKTELSNTNLLLWEIPNTVGIKTGRTEAAGEVLIYEYKDEAKNIMIVVMGSLDRFYDTKQILNWIFESYSW